MIVAEIHQVSLKSSGLVIDDAGAETDACIESILNPGRPSQEAGEGEIHASKSGT